MVAFMEPKARDSRILTVLAAVESDLSKAWTASEMAQLVTLSVSRFEHVFVAERGVSPARLVSQMRLIEAHRLLCRTHLSVREIALNVGFRDRSYFNRSFRAMFGCPPSALRGARHR
jgi:transcriptional regulator GlxA family with amidase domain